MFSKPLSHVRHNPVAYLALFVALGGTAFAARPLITGTDVQNGSLTDADIAAANKDGAAGTPSLRTLGTGARQAMHGNAKLGTSHFSHTIPAVNVVGVNRAFPPGDGPPSLTSAASSMTRLPSTSRPPTRRGSGPRSRASTASRPM